MTSRLTAQQLTGRDTSHLTTLACGNQLHALAANAFRALQAEARESGFDLSIASGFRSFERQCAIWNAKATGQRPVHDDNGHFIDLDALSPSARVHAIMRFSALPGTSRHHWGSDLDVFDAAAMPPGYQLALSPAEVAAGGLFDPLHCWLDTLMAKNQSHGFFRPYAVDRGGVAPERWHLSFAPLSRVCESACDSALFTSALEVADIELREAVAKDMNALLQRYVFVPENWCPAQTSF